MYIISPNEIKPMVIMVNTIEDLRNNVEKMKRDNTSVGKNVDDRYLAFSEEDINDFIEKCWNLVPEIETLSDSKFKKLSFDIDRALSSFNSSEEALNNFKMLNLSNSSAEFAPFVEIKFYDDLRAKPIFKNSTIAGNIQVQLAASILNKIAEPEKEKLFKITAEILSGVVSKNGLSEFDTDIVKDGNRVDPYLLISVITYIEDNFDVLESFDSRKLSFIGLGLKNAYKNVISKGPEVKVRGITDNNESEKIAASFRRIDLNEIRDREIENASFNNVAFIDSLKKSNRLITAEMAENIKVQFSNALMNETLSIQSDELYQTSSNLLVGLITDKGVSRSIDPKIINNNRLEQNLVIAMTRYINTNFKKLESYDEKTQKFIGGYLKEIYKENSIIDANKLEKAFNSIDTDILALAKKNVPSGLFANLSGSSHPSIVRQKDKSIIVNKN